MAYNVEEITVNKEKGRVLFTGNGETMIDNLIEHIPDRYQMLKCPPVDADFSATLRKFRPHTIVVCLLDETREMLRMYFVLEDDERYQNLPVIVIGREEDCSQFRKKTVIKNMEIFERPFDRNRFLESLDQFVKSGRENEPEAPEEEAPHKQEENRTEDGPKPQTRKLEKMIRMSEKKSILVVDDDILMLNTIKSYLQDLYEITVVPNGKLALRFLEKKSADLVLLDYMMPEMDGPEVLRRIREESREPNIPVIFLTGVSDKDLVLKGLEYHPKGYLLKPVNRDILLEKVTEVLLGL